MGQGVFITIEGIEGAGKSTQAKFLARAVERCGREALLTHEPGGGGRVGETLRTLLKDPLIWRSLGLAEVFLYAAARANHLETLILPALERGAVVICDRFLDSTRVYQGYGRGQSGELIEKLHALPPLDRHPDLTLFLDVPVPDGLQRARGRGGPGLPGYDEESVEFFRRVRKGFLDILAREPGRMKLVSALPPKLEVHRAVVGEVSRLVPGLVPLEAVS